MKVIPFDKPHGIDLIRTGDAFFLDTNFIVSHFHSNDKYHEASAFFLQVLRYYHCKLYINSTVIAESINSLARAYFVDDMLYLFHHLYPTVVDSLSPQQIHEKKAEFRKKWFNEVLKYEEWVDGLAYYNKIAADKVMQLVPLCKTIPTTNTNLHKAIAASYEIPLGSTDAMILTEAFASGVHGIHIKGLISYDHDIKDSVEKLGKLTWRAWMDNAQFLNRSHPGGHTYAYNVLIRRLQGLEQQMRIAMGINPVTNRPKFDEKYKS